MTGRSGGSRSFWPPWPEELLNPFIFGYDPLRRTTFLDALLLSPPVAIAMTPLISPCPSLTVSRRSHSCFAGSGVPVETTAIPEPSVAKFSLTAAAAVLANSSEYSSGFKGLPRSARRAGPGTVNDIVLPTVTAVDSRVLSPQVPSRVCDCEIVFNTGVTCMRYVHERWWPAASGGFKGARYLLHVVRNVPHASLSLSRH